MEQAEKDKTFDYPYFSQTVEIYNFLTTEYPSENVYFSKYLDKPSVCLKTTKKVLEFYVAENSIYNNQVWLYSDYTNNDKQSGGGYGRLLTDLKQQVKEFVDSYAELNKGIKQMTIFDY
jgi:hypothetical protein